MSEGTLALGCFDNGRKWGTKWADFFLLFFCPLYPIPTTASILFINKRFCGDHGWKFLYWLCIRHTWEMIDVWKLWGFIQAQKVKANFQHLKRLNRFTGLFWSFDAKLHNIGHQTSFIAQSYCRLFFCFLHVFLSFFWVVFVFVPDLSWSKEKWTLVANYSSDRKQQFSSLFVAIGFCGLHSIQR